MYMSTNVMYSAELFMMHGPDLSPAFYFYNQGYDVFMSNLRGTTFSRRHETLDPDVDREFWAFNYGSYEIDQRANIQYILDLTQQAQVYVYAPAVGATAFIIGMSFYPDWYQQRVITAAFMGPATTFSYTRSQLLLLFINFPGLLDLMRNFLIGELFPHNFMVDLYSNII